MLFPSCPAAIFRWMNTRWHSGCTLLGKIKEKEGFAMQRLLLAALALIMLSTTACTYYDTDYRRDGYRYDRYGRYYDRDDYRDRYSRYDRDERWRDRRDRDDYWRDRNRRGRYDRDDYWRDRYSRYDRERDSYSD
jgi:hypothetical protein